MDFANLTTMPEVAEENNNLKIDDDPPVVVLPGSGDEVPKARLKKVKIDLNTSEIKPAESDSVEVKQQKEFVVAEENLQATDKPATYKVKLERVLGLTVPSNAGLACAPSSGVVAYPAGCSVVLYNSRKNRQNHIVNTAKKTITSVGFSEDGRYLVTGECGHLPMVRVWDAHERHLVAEFSGHKYGINCVAFAPNGKYIVSVGSQHDMIVNVWDWRSNVKVASNKVSTKVKSISFAENGNYFVTAGNRHVKFWYLEYSRSKYKEPVPLMGRSAILGEQRNNYFCDVACGRGEMGDSTFAITKSGLLCEFNNRRLLDKWVELRTQSANCLVVGEDFVFIGCADGIVRCFSPHTMQFITTLPRTHYLGVDVSKGLTISHMASHPPDAKYPDATAITYDEQNFKVTVVYNDHSIYVWDVRDIKKVGKSRSFIFHSACIWGLEVYPMTGDDQKPVLPPGSFITCSSDDTIRIWNISHNMSTNTVYKRNIYSDELLKTIYVDNELNFIKEVDNSNPDVVPKETYDQRNGVRCIRISHDGKQLASGDRAGNIRIHELQFMDELCKIEAHDAEVLCLEYSGKTILNGDPNKMPNNKPARHVNFLASASRDRLIHVFDATRNYSFLHTLDDHSSSITAVKFLRGQVQPGGMAHPESSVQMVSCGADKSIIFREVSLDKRGLPEFQRGNHLVGKTTLYDMEIDHNHKHVLTACQDRNIRVYTVANGKHSRTFKGSLGEDGTLIKVALDRSGMYAATSCTDKTLSIYDYMTGECMATMFGHSELVTGLKFSNDCKHLISVSGDGCIFIWRLPPEMTANMIAKLSQLGQPSKSRAYISNQKPNNQEDIMEIEGTTGKGNDYRFSIGKLPVWAKKQIFDRSGSLTPPSSPPNQKGFSDHPKGRWAQRVGNSGQTMSMRSHYDSDSIIQFPPTPPDSKESSSLEGPRRSSGPSGKNAFFDDNVDDYNSLSEVENFQHGLQSRVTFKEDSLAPPANRARGVTDDSSLGSFNVESNEHDADIDEFSDGLTTQDDGGESTEPEHTENTLFFGQVEEIPSSYTVNATDVEQLRRSKQHSKKVRPLDRLGGESATTPSQESDFDDEEEELSTPSADQADKHILSSLSVSSENVDLVGRRERFLKSNFDSLSTTDVSVPHLNNSISNQYREGSAVQRNAVTIARAQSLRDTDQNKRREELQKRIEETRKKLQNIGYRSILRGSQSISDLSNIHDNPMNQQDRPNSSAAHGPRGNRLKSSTKTLTNAPQESCTAPTGSTSTPISNDPARSRNFELYETDDAGMRRACSLSDLNKQRRMLPAPPVSVSGKKSVPDRTPPQDIRKGSTPEDVPSYMRSTSASTKKERQMAPQSLSMQQRRRSSVGVTQSTSDLRSPTKEAEEDTSSEENLIYGRGSRRRSSSSGGGSQDRIALAGNSPWRNNGHVAQMSNLMNAVTRSERDLTKVTKVRVRTNTKENANVPGTFIKQRTKMKTTTMIVSDPSTPNNSCTSIALHGNGNRDLDVVRAPLNRQLAEATSLELQKASDNLVQLYKRISLDYDLEESSRKDLLHRLASTAGIAQQTLRPVTPAGIVLGNSDFANAALASINQILSSKQGKALTGPNGDNVEEDLRNNPYFQHMIENYANLIQQQQQQQQQRHLPQLKQQHQNNGPTARPPNHGPSWC